MRGLLRGLLRGGGAISSAACLFLGEDRDFMYSFTDTPYFEREMQNSSFSESSSGTLFFSNLYSCEGM